MFYGPDRLANLTLTIHSVRDHLLITLITGYTYV